MVGVVVLRGEKMTNEQTKLIYVQMDTAQIESRVSKIAEVLEELESTIKSLGSSIIDIFFFIMYRRSY